MDRLYEFTGTELRDLITDVTKIGVMEAVRAYEPTHDFIKKSELIAFLKFNHYDKSIFDRLVTAGEITLCRREGSDHSPIGYSKLQIQRAFTYLRSAKWNVKLVTSK